MYSTMDKQTSSSNNLKMTTSSTTGESSQSIPIAIADFQLRLQMCKSSTALSVSGHVTMVSKRLLPQAQRRFYRVYDVTSVSRSQKKNQSGSRSPREMNSVSAVKATPTDRFLLCGIKCVPAAHELRSKKHRLPLLSRGE